MHTQMDTDALVSISITFWKAQLVECKSAAGVGIHSYSAQG